MYAYEADSREEAIKELKKAQEQKRTGKDIDTQGQDSVKGAMKKAFCTKDGVLAAERLKHYPTFLCGQDIFPLQRMTSYLRLATMPPWDLTWNGSFARYYGFETALALPAEILADKEAVARWQKEDIRAEDVQQLEQIAKDKEDKNLLYLVGMIHKCFENKYIKQDAEAAEKCFLEAEGTR